MNLNVAAHALTVLDILDERFKHQLQKTRNKEQYCFQRPQSESGKDSSIYQDMRGMCEEYFAKEKVLCKMSTDFPAERHKITTCRWFSAQYGDIRALSKCVFSTICNIQ